jgi:probable F420-dependent oxidoreductase
MRFHQGVAFLETDQLLDLCRATDEMGYSGITVSDHIFFPKQLNSRYPYSPYEDGSPIWQPHSDWPDSWCLISAMAAVTKNLRFTTSVYIAPARDLYTVAKLVGTAAVISDNRVTLGVGAGWCEDEFVATGQGFHDRGKRLDDMIPALRALWGAGDDGWTGYHGSFYDVPAMQMNPRPTEPVPIMVGGISDAAIRRMARLSDGFLATGPYTEEEAVAYVEKARKALAAEGRSSDGFPIFMALAAEPAVDTYKRMEDAGVTDLICAPWMFAARPDAKDYRSPLEAKLRATEDFATRIIAKM